MRRAREKFEHGEKFPPSLGELIAWSDIPTDGEMFDIRARVFSSNPANEIERWICSRYLFNLRRMPEREVMKNLRSAYAQAIRLQRDGKLFAEERELLALPAESSVNEVYQLMSQIDVSAGIKNRIARIRSKAGKEKAPEIDSGERVKKCGTVALTGARKRRLPHKS